MSGLEKSKSLRSLDALLRVREIDERRTLQGVTSARSSIEDERGRLERLRETRQRVIERLEERMSGAHEARDADGVIADRVYLDCLRQRESRVAEELERRRREWAVRLDGYRDARSRRRVSQTLRHRTAGEIEEERRLQVERLTEDSWRGVRVARWWEGSRS